MLSSTGVEPFCLFCRSLLTSDYDKRFHPIQPPGMTIATERPRERIASGLKFPEGPVAMPDGSVILVEIARGTLTRVRADGQTEVIADLGGGPNGAAIGPDGQCYVCNNGGFDWFEDNGVLIPGNAPADYQGGSIQRVDLATGNWETLYTECNGQPLKGPNDLVFDGDGGFWFTDTGKTYDRTCDRSGVYYASSDGSHIEEVFYPFQFCNGVALSADDSTLYFSETMSARIWRFPLAGPGKPAVTPAPFDATWLLHGAGGMTGFDSMAMDGAGNICQATLFRGGITVVPGDGGDAGFIALPDPFITNICFGGEDLTTAYVTAAACGELWRLDWPHPGLALHFLNR